jgi:hypothetical protein
VSDQAAAWLVSSVLPPLGALRTAPATARGHVRGTLAAWRLSELSDTVELVVSELAANAVNASAGPDGHPAHLDGRIPVIRVRLFAGEAVLVAEVWDEADGVPARKSVGDTDESGRGLDLVHELTSARWGWYHASSGPGKCVWAEFPIPSRPGRRRIAAGRIPPVNGMPNGAESGHTRPGSGNERLDLNPNQEVTWKGH